MTEAVEALEAGTGVPDFRHFNDLARGGTGRRSAASRNVPGPSVPQKETDTWAGSPSAGLIFVDPTNPPRRNETDAAL